ncbi:OmpA family protein [Fretibacter rubidus]|uniref:OmpA family protein n=1 Tax=Fretibacter rubidus TaxID=570162 RepID=UPI003529D733
MKHRLLLALSTAALMTVPSLASAQDDAGWYVRGNVGYGTHTDIDLTGDLVGDVESEGNIAGSVGVGYDFGNNWRLEGDLAQLWTDLGAISQLPNTSAKLETKTAFINAIYDFSEFGRWEPYIGAGLGLVRGNTTLTAHDFPSASLGTAGVQNVSNPACVGAVACSFKDGDTGLGWQLLAGLGYQISDSLTWDTHYRYTNSNNLDFVGTKAPSLGSTSAAAATMENVGAHAVMTGFRYKFGQTGTKMVKVPLPAAPRSYTCWDGSSVLNAANCPAEPRPQMQCWDGTMVEDVAQCPTRETFTCPDGTLVYDQNECVATRSLQTIGDLCGADRMEIIYYEFNKARSAETQNTINRILDIGEFCNVDSVLVTGHTDASGSAAYNLRLSERRAKDARDELVAEGVDAAKITSQGMGETQLFIPTADGVKEQLNRRTEVLIRLSTTGGTMMSN